MKCNHNDCFTCPYPDCIMGTNDAAYKDPVKLEKKKKRRRAYHREYYKIRKARKEKQNEGTLPV